MKAKAVVFTDIKQVSFQEVEVPELGVEDVWVDLEYSWISNGTESSFLLGERISGEQMTRVGDSLPFPHVAGYQKVGIVRKVGSDVEGLRLGDRVFASISAVNEMHFSTGGHINPAITHRSQVWKLPDHGDSLAYAPLVLVQVGYNCGMRPNIQPGDLAVVIGDGMVGQWAAQTLLHRGAEVIVLGHSDERLKLLQDGIRSYNIKKQTLDDVMCERHDVNAVVDTVGAMETFWAIKPRMKLNSHLVSAGFLGGLGVIDIQELRAQEITLHCPSGWTKQRMDETLQGIHEGWLQTLPLITHRFPVNNAREAWNLIFEKNEPFLGVVFDWKENTHG